ncbi:MAG: nicotinamidase [Myxococcaceae bacterium]|nr:nicotinamidase [Myxococcaceae bacterium]
MPLPLPDHYDPKQVSQLYLERGGLIAEAAELYAKKHGIKPAGQDRTRIAAFGIDVQVGFCTPGASLFVPGAVEDTRRTVEWLYRNLDRLSGLFFSMDTHRVFQIFHPAWWVDANGNHPAPMTPISHEEVRAGRWTAVSHPKESLEYTKRLEASGKYVLTIWPYHTLLGGLSHALVPAVMEAALFHAHARRHQTHFETKGTHAMTENYSVLSPEVTEVNGQVVGAFNAPFFKMLLEYDRVYVFGQAKSHCVLSTLNDMQQHLDPKLLGKIYILEDAMSPVPSPPLDPLPDALNFPMIADQAIARWKAAGMNIVKTTDEVKP